MITNIRLELSDEERSHLALNCFGGKGMVSRKEVTNLVTAYIALQIEGEDNVMQENARSDRGRIELRDGLDDRRDDGSMQRPGNGFIPSRGDESYVFKAKDSELHNAVSSVLDGLSLIEKITWEYAEQNRKE